ncbi:MAG: hypothetical protein A3G33_04870 [Omnitrophica bacterium RIFCSPLOWO2_12_FULL_44_17]|uniref:CstA N-terminal domain-containing protein n=1 Tax=Candidatus Danuiimicrobium aquiferis TaxID=1801832 RepID=A0A1G1KRU3_9BACT|nr:MAG: hypothetical protein A3B72_11085 [Omnitrophica bacterium RIFCSPHIGHO2_02_FULL_45_28]OGW88620.1 MAG: hypothetical protein A3E74_06490 [Omnitrophica bacterium RIFCSPHIGHO2_12_FULL_44_12]OGW95279.1 MAG: hypothetical protein A3G33_04870 [Omnitrophica bacterium RIFCSPLOWO2_12_FULL_44_17]
MFLIAGSILILVIAYSTYGALLKRLLDLRDDRKTPAEEINDGVDFVPAKKFYLLGQQLSAIAAAGPIVGPILAGLWFGWAPALLWILLGSIFIGGVHDLTALVASVRHQGKSIAEVIRENVGGWSYKLFLLFLWFSLVYIVTAFADITASTFADAESGPAVASSSMMYLGLALVMGVVMRRFRWSLTVSTVIFLPLVLVCIYLGRFFPLKIIPVAGIDVRTMWNILLLFYCFIASVIPVWLLLQPRGYLGGFFLVITVGCSFAGIVIGGLMGHFKIEYPAFTQWFNPQHLPLFPVLFITVACGACSGFHAIVSSGTTSKQLAKETDAKLVGYGGMLLEGVVAIIALATLMILSSSKAAGLRDPNMIYANGIASFLNVFGIDRGFALNFALLAFATFVYDTLDVATRLGRYLVEEVLNWRHWVTPYVAAILTLLLPMLFLMMKITDEQGNVLSTWKVFWSVFGASNQLLAGFVLFTVSLWLFRSRKKFLYALIPSFFMTFVALSSLCYILRPYWSLHGKLNLFHPVAVSSLVLLSLSILLIANGIKRFRKLATS